MAKLLGRGPNSLKILRNILINNYVDNQSPVGT